MKVRVSNLSKKNAVARKTAKFSNIHYKTFLNLINTATEEYEGAVTVSFTVEEINNIFINYSGNEVKYLKINEKVVDNLSEYLEKNWVEDNLYFEESLLKKGTQNEVTIAFKNNYSKNGDGLCLTFGVDKLNYKYTQTEPYGLNMVFPNFDQPDLKANIKYYISCEKDDVAISLEKISRKFESVEEIKTETDDEFIKFVYSRFSDQLNNMSVFNESKKLSTYLFGFCVGPFVEYKLEESKLYNNIPISIYCRKSMAKYMDKQINEVYFPMVQGLKIFESFFSVKYPFVKNDLIFLPEYKVGAMEYPGCITINELYIFIEDPIPVTRRLAVSHTIYHELAHMWFGNLVTMIWWDDLWLNESFAELVSIMVMEYIDDYINTINYDTWLLLRTEWGMKTDEKNSTHPISCDIVDTSAASSIFDGISYSKGPGVLKQLVKIIGVDKFKANIKNYFEKYAWGNTDLNMFLEEMGRDLDGFDITEFRKDFIETACLNLLISKRVEEGIEVTQTFVLDNYNHLRNHKITIACFDENLEIIKKFDANILKQEKTLVNIEKDVLDRSKAIYINYDFHAWVKFNLDEESTNFLLSNMDKFNKYTLNCKNFLSNYYNLVRDSKIKSSEYIEKVIEILPFFAEDQALIGELLPCLLGSVTFYMPKNLKEKYYKKINTAVFKLLNESKNPIMAKKFFDAYTQSCYAKSDILSLKVYLDNDYNHESLKLTINDKWGIYLKLVQSGLLKKDFETEYLAKLEAEDDTDMKHNVKIVLKAFYSTTEERKALMDIYIDGKSKILNYKEKIYSIRGFKSRFLDSNVKHDYYDKFFENIIKVFRDYGYENGRSFMIYLLPKQYNLCKSISKLDELMGQLTESEYSIKRELLSQKEDLVRIRNHLALYN